MNSIMTAVSSSNFTASKMDEISLNVGDNVCIYNKLRHGWAEGHNLTKDSFGFFPMKNVKTADIKNYQPLTAKQMDMKRLNNLFRNSDSDSEAAFFAFHLDYQSHLCPEVRINNIIKELKETESAFIHQLQHLIQTTINPLLLESWFLECNHDLMYSIIEIYQLHCSLVKDLEGITQNSKIGELLLGYSKDFKDTYSKYVRLLPKAITMMSEDMDDFLRSKLEDCSSDSAVFLKFISLLHVPFQRRKDVFASIRKVLQLIPVDHPHHQSVLACWKSFKITVSVLGELLTRSESGEELYTLQSQMINYQGPPLNEFGSILLKGPFNVKYGSRKKSRFVYLLEKCIIVLKGKKSFLGHDKLSEYSIKSNSAGEIALATLILLDKEHFRTVAAWDNHDKNAFRIIYVDGDNSTQFIELSALSRNIASNWISEIRKVTQQNSVDSPLPSKRTSSLESKMSDSTPNMDINLISKPRTGSFISYNGSIPTPEGLKSLKPYLQRHDATYASPPSTVNKCNDVKLDKISSQESLVEQTDIQRKSSSASLPSLQPPSLSSGGSDQFEDFQSFTRRRLLSFKSFEEGKEMTKLSNPDLDEIDHFSESAAENTVSRSSFNSEVESNLEGVNSYQRISREQFRSLYGSMQSKVREYIDLKDRIDRITENINKI